MFIFSLSLSVPLLVFLLCEESRSIGSVKRYSCPLRIFSLIPSLFHTLPLWWQGDRVTDMFWWCLTENKRHKNQTATRSHTVALQTSGSARDDPVLAHSAVARHPQAGGGKLGSGRRVLARERHVVGILPARADPRAGGTSFPRSLHLTSFRVVLKWWQQSTIVTHTNTSLSPFSTPHIPDMSRGRHAPGVRLQRKDEEFIS